MVGWPFPLKVYSVRRGQLISGKLAKFLHKLGFHFFVASHSWDPPYSAYLRYCEYLGCWKRQEKTEKGWEDY